MRAELSFLLRVEATLPHRGRVARHFHVRQLKIIGHSIDLAGHSVARKSRGAIASDPGAGGVPKTATVRRELGLPKVGGAGDYMPDLEGG